MNKRLVLSFHGIGEPTSWIDEAERQHWCSEGEFVSILESIPQISNEVGIPIEITFDDGYSSDIFLAAPALQKRGLKAAFFVCAGRIGKPGYLDAYQLRSLAGAGMSVGSHGWDHVDWRVTRNEIDFEREILGARRFIEDVLSAGPIDSVAIPFGSYDRHVMRAVTHAFSVVYTSDAGLASIGRKTVPRETYRSHQWGADTLRNLATQKVSLKSIRQSLAVLYKQYRGPP
jgi:peptidoglycan/xylan/chitin deacetylase (PgdA/CDA1 family)